MTFTTTRRTVALLAVMHALTDAGTAAGATNTPGALLFHFSSEPVANGGPWPRPSGAHVAISVGAGNR